MNQIRLHRERHEIDRGRRLRSRRWLLLIVLALCGCHSGPTIWTVDSDKVPVGLKDRQSKFRGDEYPMFVVRGAAYEEVIVRLHRRGAFKVAVREDTAILSQHVDWIELEGIRPGKYTAELLMREPLWPGRDPISLLANIETLYHDAAGGPKQREWLVADTWSFDLGR